MTYAGGNHVVKVRRPFGLKCKPVVILWSPILHCLGPAAVCLCWPGKPTIHARGIYRCAGTPRGERENRRVREGQEGTTDKTSLLSDRGKVLYTYWLTVGHVQERFNFLKSSVTRDMGGLPIENSGFITVIGVGIQIRLDQKNANVACLHLRNKARILNCAKFPIAFEVSFLLGLK